MKLTPWFLVLAGCQPMVDSFATNAPPGAPRYADSPVICYLGVALAADTPTLSGGKATLFTIQPALPAGLTLDPSSGTISGTASALAAAQGYTVTASNGFGSAQGQITLSVIDTAPAALSYASPIVAVRNQVLAAVTPQSSGGTPTSYLVSPAFPAGITLDARTGIISGTPTSVSTEASYVVTAANAFGEATTTLSLAVNDQSPDLFYYNAPFVFLIDQPATTNAPENTGGTITSCALESTSPSLPAGLNIAADCTIFGIPTATSPAAIYTLAVGYAGGAVDVAVDVTVNGLLAIAPPSISLPASSGQQFAFSPTGGVPPYSFSIVSGPGTITGQGTYTAATLAQTTTIQVVDARGSTNTASVRNVRELVNGPVRAIASDTSAFYLGGDFTLAYPFEAPGITSVDAESGAPNLGFDEQTGFDGPVNAIAVNGNSIFVAGSFANYRGRPVSKLVKLDFAGELDTNFTPYSGFDGSVNAIAFDATSVYAGGSFSNYKQYAVQSLAKLDLSTGALDTTFTEATGIGSGGGSGSVRALLASGGKIYVGGLFQTYRGASVTAFVALDTTTGDADPNFIGVTNPGFTGGVGGSNAVYAILLANNKLYLGGNFTTFNNVVVGTDLVRLDLSGAVVPFTNPPAVDGTVYALASAGTTFYAAGGFTTPNGMVAAFDLASGQVNSHFSPTFSISTNALPQADALVATTDALYVGGNFTGSDTLLTGHWAKLTLDTGMPDSAFTASVATDGTIVNALAAAGGKIFVGGDMRFYRGSNAAHIAKFDLNTNALDTTFTGSGLLMSPTGFATQATVKSLVLGNNALFVGGNFSQYQAQNANGLIMLDPSSGAPQSFVAGSGLAAAAEVDTLLISGSPAALYAGGSFASYDGGAANNFAKLSLSDGSLDTTFNPSAGSNGTNGEVVTLAGGSNAVFAGGKFTQYRGVAVDYLVAVDFTGTATAFNHAGGAFDQPVTALATNNNISPYTGGVYIAGAFTKYQGNAVSAVFRADQTSGTTSSWSPGVVLGNAQSIFALAPSPLPPGSGSVFIAGTAFGFGANAIAGMTSASMLTGTLGNFSVGTGFNNTVRALDSSGATFLVAGDFTTYQGNSAYYWCEIDAAAGNRLD